MKIETPFVSRSKVCTLLQQEVYRVNKNLQARQKQFDECRAKGDYETPALFAPIQNGELSTRETLIQIADKLGIRLDIDIHE